MHNLLYQILFLHFLYNTNMRVNKTIDLDVLECVNDLSEENKDFKISVRFIDLFKNLEKPRDKDCLKQIQISQGIIQKKKENKESDPHTEWESINVRKLVKYFSSSLKVYQRNIKGGFGSTAEGL